MAVTIYYCRSCGFRRQAEEIADVLDGRCGLKTELSEGFWGTFRVERDGREVYNRWKTRGWLGRVGFGRTPTADDIVALLCPQGNAAENRAPDLPSTSQ